MQFEQQPAPLWKIPFETKNNIADFKGDVFLCLIKGTKYRLHPVDGNQIDLFKNSVFCQKNSLCLTADEIVKALPSAAKHKLGEKNLIIQIPERYESLSTKYITEMGDFAGLLQIAEIYDLDIGHILRSPNYMIWFLHLKDEIQVTYKNNNIMFTANFDSKIINKLDISKTVPNGNPTASNYPIKTAKYLNISVKSLGSSPKELQEYFHTIISTVSKISSAEVTLFKAEFISCLLYSMKYYDCIVGSPENFKLAVNNCPRFYLFFKYTLRLMYLEERGTYIQSKRGDRFILNSSVLCQLASQPATGQIFDHPYIPCIFDYQTSQKALDLSYYLDMNFRGIRPLVQIKERLNIFSFKALSNWKPAQVCKDGTTVMSAINGSIITAISTKNPLEESFKYTSDYFEHFYPSRKIEYVNSETKKELQQLDKQKTNQPLKIDQNASLLYQENSDSDDDLDLALDLELDSEQEDQINEGKQEIESDSENTDEPDNKPEDPYKGTSDIDIMIETTSMDIFDEVAHMHFNDIATARPDVKLTMNKVITENKYKYSILGLERSIDIFSVNSIPGVIVKFHLGCVRAWFSDDLYAFPSFISAALTGLNIDVRWVSCNKDLRDILVKYWTRGYGTILSASNRRHIADHIQKTFNSDLVPVASPQSGYSTRRAVKRTLENTLGFDKHHLVYKCNIYKGLCSYKKPYMFKFQKNKIYCQEQKEFKWMNPTIL